jgi:hypothetical protein
VTGKKTAIKRKMMTANRKEITKERVRETAREGKEKTIMVIV